MRQFSILLLVWLTASKSGLDFGYKKLCTRVVSRVAKRLPCIGNQEILEKSQNWVEADLS